MQSDPDTQPRRHGHRVTSLAIRVLTPVVVAVLSLTVAMPAQAQFQVPGTGAGQGNTNLLSAPTAVSPSSVMNSGTVPVTWGPAALAGGQPPQGYYVVRQRTSDSLIAPACGTNATALISATNCDDLSVADGTYRYRVIAVQESWSSVSALSSPVTVVNNSTLPSVSVSAILPVPNTNGYNNTTPVLVTVAAMPGAFGTPIASVTTWVDSGAPTTTPGALANQSVSGNGTHVVSFYATDLSGRQSPTGTYTVRIDTVAPAAPSAPVLTVATDTGASSSDGITMLTTPSFTGTAEAGSTVRLYDGVTLIGTGVATGGSYTITSSVLSAASHTITARSTDLADNVSPTSASSTIVIDTTAPATPSTPALTAASDTGRSNTDRITRLTTPTFTGTADTNATVRLYEGATSLGSGVATTGTWTATSSTLTNGVHSITARAIDVAGNTSADSAAVSVTIDTVAPAAPSKPTMTTGTDTGSSNTDGVTRQTRPVFTGTAEIQSIVTLRDNGTAIVVGAAISTTSYSLTSTTLANGTHPITTTATDTAGNVSLPSVVSTAVIDTVAPVTSSPRLTTASDTGISATDQITNLTTITVTGTTQANATVNLRSGTSTVATGTANASGVYVLTATLGAGTRSLTARGTDLAGNVGSYSSATSAIIDTTRPTLTLNQATGQADPALTSPVNFGATFSETIYDFTNTDVTITGTASATTAAVTGSGTTYNVAISGMTSTGTVIVNLAASRVTDAAGNTNRASTSTDNTVTYTGP